jgi:hypothetical protein
MDPPHPERILRGQGRLRRHGIAAMCRNDFLVGLETSVALVSFPFRQEI